MSRPRGYLAQALYDKYNNDQYIENYDYSLWYKLPNDGKEIAEKYVRCGDTIRCLLTFSSFSQISHKVLRLARARRHHHALDSRVEGEVQRPLAPDMAYFRKAIPKDFPHANLLEWLTQARQYVHLVGECEDWIIDVVEYLGFIDSSLITAICPIS